VIELDSFADFEDGEKTLNALERLYLRAIQYGSQYNEEVNRTGAGVLRVRIIEKVN
jgi:hypothetical protein